LIQNFVEDIEKTIASSKIVLTSNIEKYFGPSMETVYLKGRVLIIDTSIFEIAVLAEESRQKVIIEKYRLHYMDASFNTRDIGPFDPCHFSQLGLSQSVLFA